MTKPDYTFTIHQTTHEPPQYGMMRTFPGGKKYGPRHLKTREEVILAIQENLPNVNKPISVHINTLIEISADNYLIGERPIPKDDLRAIIEGIQQRCKITT